MPVTPAQALDYLAGINTPAGAQIAYQRDDGQRGRHWRNPDKRRNPGVAGDGWQLRRFDPVDPASSTAIALAEGEKDAAILAAAGLIAFTAPRGAQSLPQADFTELVALAKDTGLPVLLCGDNDWVGRKAMRKVRGLLKRDHHLDATYLFGEEKGSIADLHTKDLKALIRVKLAKRNPNWQQPIRNQAPVCEIQMHTSQEKHQECWRRIRDMGPGAMREYCRLPAVLRMGKLPPRREVLEGQASADGGCVRLRWG